MTTIRKRLSDILFIDIETVSSAPSLQDLPSSFQKLWQVKAQQIARDKNLDFQLTAQLYSEKSGIFSEFAKIICISVGIFLFEKNAWVFKVKSFYGDDEKSLLGGFVKLIRDHYNKPKSKSLCGHNIREFDIPFICRRLLINKMQIPKSLNIAGKKPWQVTHLLDTMQLWRFGDYKHYTSLDLLAGVLGIESPKDDIDGSQVHSIYYNEGDIERIVKYCEKDVFCCAQVYAMMKSIELPEEINVISVTEGLECTDQTIMLNG